MSAELISFDAERVSRYLNDVFAGYLGDPADSDYQRGFLAACLTVYREGLGKGAEDDRLKLLDQQTSG
jgi:hypothetical protein